MKRCRFVPPYFPTRKSASEKCGLEDIGRQSLPFRMVQSRPWVKALCNSSRAIPIWSFYKGMEVIKWKIPKLRRSFKPTSPIYPLQPFGMRGKNSGRWRICLVIATQLFCSKISSEKLQFSKVLQNCRRIFFLKTNDSSPAPEHKQNTQITFLRRVTRWLNSWPKLQRTFATVCGWTSSFSTISCTLLASRDQTGWFFSLSLTPCFRSNIAKLWYAAEAW